MHEFQTDPFDPELMPSVQELAVFTALQAAGSITDASEQLHLSQSQLSRILRGLEHKLRATLFHRSTAGLRMTAEGKLFARTSSNLRTAYLQQMHQFRNELAGEAGEVRVAVLPSMAFEFLGSWTETFRQSHPRATITATDDVSGNALRQVIEGTTDVAISACLLRMPDGQERRLFPELDTPRLIPLLAESFALVSPPEAELPANLDWDFSLSQATIGFTGLASVHRSLDLVAQNEGQAYRPETRTNSPLTIAGLVESGLGSAIVPESNLGIMNVRRLKTTRLSGYQRVVCIVAPATGQTTLVRHFINTLTQ